MRNIVLTIILTAMIFISFGQINDTYHFEGNKKKSARMSVSPIFSFEYDFSSYKNYSSLILFNHYACLGGVQLFDKLNLTANIGFIHTQHLIDGQNKKVQAIPLLFCIQYRFLKDFWISPAVRFDVGSIIYSNAKNQYVNSRLEIEPNMGAWSEPNSLFKSWGTYFSPQLLMSFKIKNFYWDFGVGYNHLTYRLLETGKVNVSGIQLKSGITYRFKTLQTKN